MSMRQVRAAYCTLGILLLFLAVTASAQPLLRVTFLDVGQGDAILIRTSEKTILLDAGDDRLNAANGVIIPYLKREGITKIDTCIISHPHRDHFGGFLDLLQAIPIGEFQFSSDTLGTGDPEESSSDALVYMRMYNLIKEKKIPYNKLHTGATLHWGKGIKVEVLHADETPRRSPDQPPHLIQRGEVIKSPANEQSLIIKATAGKISYLFTGDAEKGAEGRAIELFREKLPSTILKSPHHGSKTSSNYPFMDLVKPEYGIISVGAKNSFGHPSKETLEKYAFYKMKVFRTDQDGTIDTFTDGQTVQIVSNQSPLAITKPPEIISLTANSATIQWTTNKTSNSVVKYGTSEYAQQKVLDPYVTVHTVTLTGLKPSTTYLFQVISQDERQPEQVVSAEGRLTTPAGSGLPLPFVAGMSTLSKTIYQRKPFTVRIDLKNPAQEPHKGCILSLYHSSIAPSNLLGTTNTTLAASSQETFTFPIELGWMGKVELIAVLTSNRDIIDTCSIVVDVLPKFILVDCAHGNIDYFTGRFAGMKMDLYNRHGFSMKSVSKMITPAALEGSFVLIIPEPKEALAAEEVAAIKEYVSKGGSVLFFLKSDFRDLSTPHLVNPILQAIGSRIRFNDDQFCDPTNNIGPPFRAFVRVFPDPIIQGVNQLLFRSSCTLVNHQMQGLTASKDLHLLAVGDDDSYNVDTDGLNDCSFYYASATPRLPIPVVAAEDLGTGRVACFAEPLYDDRLYADPRIPTALFNSQVVAWLATAREKTLRDLLRSLDNLESIDDPDLRASRYDGLRAAALDQIQRSMVEGAEADIQAAFQEFASPAVQDLARDLRHTLQFYDLHQERP